MSIILAGTKADFNPKPCTSQHKVAPPSMLRFTSKALNGARRNWGQCAQLHGGQWPEGWVVRPACWGEANDLSEVRTNHLQNTSLEHRCYTRPFS